ncbi:hypothetical protein JIN85_03070 [Luteolibacter pohnpeiensis]|uniref:PEGA domain-containing protein n=1 Tax=Luteolibacter pohnpeiensis TaxID=454153 RepID=A0A934S187_9BACT|nr:hypothetical protein [Luteolibacter pohnpeiensis]MBK1881380.1 hypothetical protein [Luteolibacter pohnpeiensis]
MKTISRIFPLILAAALMPITIARGEEAKPVPPTGKMGFVRLVAAVAQGSGTLKIKIDGSDINPTGYNLGDVTGGLGLKAGTHEVTISREGTEEGTTKVKVENDDTTILIPFAEKVPASDEKPAYWAIRILRLKQLDVPEGKTASFVSVSQTPELKVEMRDPEGKWTPVYVKRLAVAKAAITYPRGYVPLKSKDGNIESIPVAQEGNYVVLLYDDKDGKVQSLNFQDQKFLSAD